MINNKAVFYGLIFFIIVIALALYNFPNYYANLRKPDNSFYSGQASWFDPWDLNVYVSAVKWGQRGKILLENIYSTETSQRAILYYPTYTFLGFFFPRTSPFVLFHCAAFLLGGVLIIALFQMIKVFVRQKMTALLALFLIIFGGGLGWLFFPKTASADLFITGFTFVSSFQRPHVAIGIILYLYLLVSYFRDSEKKRKFSILSLIACLFLVIYYPYYLLSYFFICGLYGLLLWLKKNKSSFLVYLLINALVCFPLAVFYYLHLRSNPTFSGVWQQKLSTPSPLMLALGYGILLILFIYQLFYPVRKKGVLFLNLWVIGSFVLAYFPFGFARFYLRGLFFPLIILAIYSIGEISLKLKINRNYFYAFLIICLPISTFFITYRRIAETETGNRWFYLTAEEGKAFDFLKNNAKKDSGVLAGYTIGNYLPAHTDSRVYFGHNLQTPKADEKIQRLYYFFGNIFSESEAKEFIASNNIDYVWWGKEEKEITNKTEEKILKYSFLKPFYENETVVIYQRK